MTLTHPPNASNVTTPGAPRRRPRVIAALAIAALLVIATAWHLTALAAYDSSALPSASTPSRLASAQLAVALEPWNSRFEWRVVTLRGLALFEAGRVDDAYWLLEPWSQTVRGDDLFRTVLAQIVTVKAPLDHRKAHLAHGAEVIPKDTTVTP